MEYTFSNDEVQIFLFLHPWQNELPSTFLFIIIVLSMTSETSAKKSAAMAIQVTKCFPINSFPFLNCYHCSPLTALLSSVPLLKIFSDLIYIRDKIPLNVL